MFELRVYIDLAGGRGVNGQGVRETKGERIKIILVQKKYLFVKKKLHGVSWSINPRVDPEFFGGEGHLPHIWCQCVQLSLARKFF